MSLNEGVKLQIVLTWTLRTLLTLLTVLAITAVGEAYFTITWELSIIANELGHIWAVVVMMIAAVCFFRSREKGRLIEIFFCIGLLPIFLRPSLSSLTSNYFSFAKLFWPVSNPKVDFKTFTYREVEGQTLTLDFYSPAHLTNAAVGSLKPAPWVFVIHGGGWQAGDSSQLADLNSYLANLGYGVVAINYRHAPEFKWPSQREDTLAALEFVRAHALEWNLDPGRYAMLGRSAGAQLAGAVAYSMPEGAPKALVSFYGPTDMVFAYENSHPGDVLDPLQLLEDFLGGKPETQKENYRTASPMEFVSKASCPTLLLHGSADPIVWVRHSQRLEAKLKKLGVPVYLIELPWATHGFDFIFTGPGGQISTNAVEDFLGKTLKHQSH